jgi:2'-5' RNA ligase
LPQRLHVSLHNLGSHWGVPRDIVGAACEAAAEVVMPAFGVAFDRVVSFAGKSGERPFVLLGGDGVTGLAVLHQRLGVALQKVGLWRWVLAIRAAYDLIV